MARVSIPENIALAENITATDMIIRGDATQLQQILLNLLNNARDAVLEQSTPAISVQLDCFEADEAFKSMHPDLESTRFAHLSVSDNGQGISEQHLDKIFEPFFTTKAVGKGTGLGLAMSYGAIQAHKGIIEVESKLDEGTRFHVYLPLCEASETLHEQEEESVLKGHGETILLVDDEAYMRNTLSDVLEDLGYSVLTASDGEQALQVFSEHSAAIDLVITDVVMPVLGGMDVAKKIRELGFGVPLILMTGYDREQVTDDSADLENFLLVNKPLNPGRLSRHLRSFLGV